MQNSEQFLFKGVCFLIKVVEVVVRLLFLSSKLFTVEYTAGYFENDLKSLVNKKRKKGFLTFILSNDLLKRCNIKNIVQNSLSSGENINFTIQVIYSQAYCFYFNTQNDVSIMSIFFYDR